MPQTTASPALHAFLRGIEPRASVLVRAHAGPGLDDAALLAKVRGDFAERAPRLPLAEWPLRYWGLLLARDELAATPVPLPDHPLYAVAHTRRLALLLRLVVGLEPAGGARVLGLSETAFRALCSDAEDKLANEGVGPDVLMRWHDAFQQQVRPAAGASPTAAPSAAKKPPPVRRARSASRWPRLSGLTWSLAAVAALLAAAFVATFLWPPSAPTRSSSAAAGGDAAPAALRQAPAAPRRDLAAELRVDPDFALVASAGPQPWDDGVGFLSWWSAEQGDALPPPVPVAEAPEKAWTALPAEAQALLAAVQSAWPALEAPVRQGLLANVNGWQALDAAQRSALVDSYRSWLALPALERSQRRARYQQWVALDDAERAALASSAARLAALPADGQGAAREQFAGLPPQRQRDWSLGPRLGRQLPELRPLLAFVPAAEQAALVDALEALGDADRVALGKQVATMGTAQRAALRAKVLAATPAERAALLRAAAGR